MADLRDQYGNPVRQTDEYGNPVGHTQGGTMGSYGTTGNHGATGYGTQGTGTGGGLGSGGYGAGHVGGGGHMQEHRVGHEGGGLTGVHHRSGSSSSSSSEDDGYGGRRKKGMKEKIKEKIPGAGGKGQDPRHTHNTVGNSPATMGQHSTYGQQPHEEYYGQEGYEKKGMTEKIKEKIPGVGGKGQDPRYTSTTAGNPPATMGQHATYGQQPHEGYGNPPAAMGQHATYGQQPHEEYYGQEGYEKKGMTEKIKEKIPGVGGKGQDPRHTNTAGYPPSTMDQHSTYGQQPHEEHYGQEGREKKGIMEKIKEKLPGGGGGNREV